MNWKVAAQLRGVSVMDYWEESVGGCWLDEGVSD